MSVSLSLKEHGGRLYQARSIAVHPFLIKPCVVLNHTTSYALAVPPNVLAESTNSINGK